jgi:transposase
LIRKVFGSSSEELDIDQLLLFEETEAKKPEDDDSSEACESSSKATTKPRKKRSSREATLPKDIPVEEITLLPDEVQASPKDYRQVGEEVTTKLDYIPAQFKKIITRRPKYVKRITSLEEQNHFYLAPLPPSLKEKSLLTPSLAAEIATNRYCDHQPYYRQEQHFLMRHRVHLPRNTMSQWMQYLATDYLSGIYTSMHQELLAETYLQADETPIKYLAPGNGTTIQGYLWTLSRPDLDNADGRGGILYHWHLGRSTSCLESLLQKKQQRFIGVLQCDGYKTYQNQRNKHAPEIELAGCWAHVRRKFFEAKSNKPKITGWILRQISNLYHIEATLRKNRAGPAEREAVRASQSIPIYKRLGKALQVLKTKRKVLPANNLGTAIDYALGQWSKLELCFKDGRIEIDNNLIENGIRPTKLGAKNWLFMGSAEAGQTNAIWFTLIESCRRRRLNPRAYLVWLFEELPTIKVSKGTFSHYTPKAYAQKLKQDQRLNKCGTKKVS